MKLKDQNKIKKAANFIEELAWLLKSKRTIDLEGAAYLLRELSSESNITFNGKKSSNTNVNDLVGYLPFLFQDEELFLYNKDIIDFAENLFDIKISRPGKRTRYELIGLVVTEITKVNKTKLKKVINALSLISKDAESLRQIKQAKQQIDFSWNEAISNLNR